VPAKCESDRIRDKNLREIDGISLYERALWNADEADCFSRICLSSDGIPPAVDFDYHRRDEALAGDVPASEVARAVLRDAFPNRLDWPEWICLLQPTSPCLRATTLEAAAELCESDVDAVVAARAGECRPCGAFYFLRSHLVAREQSWSDLFARLNAIERIVWYPLPDDEAIDVDCHADLAMAKLIIEARKHLEE
jgi:CMP-N-acetylneuraminic acid synthetase